MASYIKPYVSLKCKQHFKEINLIVVVQKQTHSKPSSYHTWLGI